MNATPARARHAAVALATMCVLLLSGCLTADSTLKADGSGTMQLGYMPPKGATKASETTRFTSDAVTVESLDVAADGKSATVKLKFTDATKLNTAPALKNITVTRTKGEGTEKLTIVLKPDQVMKLKPGQAKDVPPLKIGVTLPGAVKDATEKGATEGNKVTWTVPIEDFVGRAQTDLTVTYQAPAA